MEEGNAFEKLDPIDLHSQLEELLSAVRSAEENWRFDDRIDLATRTKRRTPK
jgi:hypothetical protein